MHIQALETLAWTRPTASRRAAGFTLIEVVVGMIIVGMVVGALCTGVLFGIRRSTNNQEELRAVQIITEKFETLRLCTWDQILSTIELDDPEYPWDQFDPDDPHTVGEEPDPFLVPTTFTAPFTPGATNSTDLVYTGTLTTQLASIAEPYSTHLLKVTISVSWPRNGQTLTRSATTYFSRYGLQLALPN